MRKHLKAKINRDCPQVLPNIRSAFNWNAAADSCPGHGSYQAVIRIGEFDPMEKKDGKSWANIFRMIQL